MARLKLSALVNQINGSVGGSTFQQGVSGQIMRTKPIPRKSSSVEQSAMRSATAQAQRAWQFSNEFTKNSWTSFSSYANFRQKKDNTRVLTGQQLFLSINIIRILHGLDIIEEPIYNWNAIEAVSLSVFYTETEIGIQLSRALDSDLEFVHFEITGPVSKGILKFTPNAKMLLVPETEVDEIFITSEYVALFSTTPNIDSKVFFRYKHIDKMSGLIYTNSFGVGEHIV